VPAVRLRARWVVPIVTAPIPDGAVLVSGAGRIAAIGPDSAVPRPDNIEVLDLGDVALLPGLVNAHSHLELTALRGLVTELPFARWIARIKQLGESLTPDVFRAGARWGVLESYAHGITTTGDTGRTGEAARAMAELGMRGVAYQEVFGPDPAQLDASIQGLQAALKALDPLASERLAIGVSPHAPFTVSDPLLAAVGALAHIQARPIAMHVAESHEEMQYVIEGRGPFADNLRGRGIHVAPRDKTPVKWALEGGLEPLAPLLIHCVHADKRDYAAIAACGGSVAHCPVSNQLLNNGRANLMLMRDEGVKAALGTDSVTAGNTLDLFAEQRAAGVGLPLTPNERLRLFTADAADALGVGGAGRLELGAWADLVAISLKEKALATAHEIEGAIAAAATAAHVMATWVEGRLVYRDGKWPDMNAEPERTTYERAFLAAEAAKSRA
jgi:5-methylthioadenosine/S-adenosylhomocysteine deaminase